MTEEFPRAEFTVTTLGKMFCCWRGRTVEDARVQNLLLYEILVELKAIRALSPSPKETKHKTMEGE